MFKKIVFLLLFLALLYSRLVGLDWGLPYHMHPDERNMANAIQRLNCEIRNSKFEIRNCLNPLFFAYGQFPLYLGYFLLVFFHFVTLKVGEAITYQEAVMVLRLISAIATIINVWLMIKIVQLILNKSPNSPTSPFDKLRASRGRQNSNFYLFISILIFTFSPYFIQFAHFGTTEALLMLFYSLTVLFSLRLINGKQSNRNVLLAGLFSGLATATKVSSAIFALVPVLAIFLNFITGWDKKKKPSPLFGVRSRKKNIKIRFLKWTSEMSGLVWFNIRLLIIFSLVVVVSSILFSPHNLVSFAEFLGTMNYETGVATGDVRVFYTRQFEYTLPIWFQMGKIFPYVLGWPQFILGLLGFFFLPWRKKENFLRFAFLVYFVPSAFLYAKWTRFMAPILPLMSVFAAVVLIRMYRYIRLIILKTKDKKAKTHIKNSKNIFIFGLNFLFFIFYILFLIPGLAYLAIYENPDVRFEASEWIYENIPAGAYILSETANVVDIPMPPPSKEKQEIPSYEAVVSFDFYHLDENPALYDQLNKHLTKSDYVFIPSRRIFKNQYCDLKLKTPSFAKATAGKQNLTHEPDRQAADGSGLPRTDLRSGTGAKFYIFGEKRCRYLRSKYPLLNNYYQRLFLGELGFVKVAQFTSYPRIELLGKTLVEFPDEDAEETWTVFDHPVIRIYQNKL